MTFPSQLLRKDDSALCLFCAAFGGKQDAAFLREAGLTDVLGIDIDRDAIVRMQPSYPPSWAYLPMDAFRYLSGEEFGCVDGAKLWPPQVVDVVTADPWSGDCEERLIDFYEELLALSRRLLVIGVTENARERAEAELHRLGVVWTRMLRSDFRGGCYWLIVEKDKQPRTEEPMSSDTQEHSGCGAPATRIIYRGPVRRRWLCDECEYKGSGRVMPYCVAVEGQSPPAGTHTGPAKRCGDEVG